MAPEVRSLPAASVLVHAPQPVLKNVSRPAPPPTPATRADTQPVQNVAVSSVRPPPGHPTIHPEIVQTFVLAGTVAITQRISLGGRASFASYSVLPASGGSINFRS